MTALKEFPSRGDEKTHLPKTIRKSSLGRRCGPRDGVSDRWRHLQKPTSWAPTRAPCTHGGAGQRPLRGCAEASWSGGGCPRGELLLPLSWVGSSRLEALSPVQK